MSDHDDNEEVPMVVGVDMQVVDYYVVAEGDSYDKHYFIIQVQVEDLKYTVDRSYVDFVELDRLLKKLHPESAVPHLPLRAAPIIEKFLAKEASNQHDSSSSNSSPGGLFGRNSFSLTRDSILASPTFKSSGISNSSALRIADGSTEIIRNRMGPLTLYLTGIACYHELLTSYPLKNFLDEEYTSMLDLTIPPTLTEFDLLLLNSPIQSCVVHRIEQHNFNVPDDHLLLWRFKTAKYDIGFSMDVNGKTRLPLTRYRASEQSICGALLVNEDSMVTLKWNNTYAKCKFCPPYIDGVLHLRFLLSLVHSKNLSWSTRVVSKDDFEQAKKQALECEEEKIRFSEQRFALQRASTRHAMTLSNIIHGSIIQAEYTEEKNLTTKMLERNKANLNEQNSLLLQDLEKAEETMEILENKLLTLEQGKKVVTESWQFSTMELENSQKELESLKISFVELENALQIRDREVLLLSNQLQESEVKENEMTDCVETIIKNLNLLMDLYGISILEEENLLAKRDQELHTTLNNYEITDTEPEQENLLSHQVAKCESLLLLTQDLLDDYDKEIQMNKETVEHLKVVRDDLQKVVRAKSNKQNQPRISNQKINSSSSQDYVPHPTYYDNSNEQQFYINPIGSRSKSFIGNNGDQISESVNVPSSINANNQGSSNSPGRRVQPIHQSNKGDSYTAKVFESNSVLGDF